MLPLSGPTFPASADELQAALQAGFARHGLPPKAVAVSAAAWPSLERLAVDLSEARASRDVRWPIGEPAEGPEVTTQQLEIVAAPLLLEGTPIELRLNATDVVLVPGAAAQGESMLTLRRSGPGRLSVEIRKEDLQKLALEAGRAAAKAKGGDLQDLQLELHSEGDRALRFEARVAAKMGFMKATLVLTGRAELDAQLQLHLSALDLQGQGMASSVAAGFIRPQLEKLQRAPIPLGVLSLGGVRLKEVRLLAGETVRAEAEFSA